MRTMHEHSFNASRLAAAVFGLALLCVSAGAQEPDAPPPAPGQRPAQALNLMQRLNLSREQRQQLREIRAQSEPEVRAQTRRVRLARRALDEAIYADAVDETLIEQRARELSAAQSALLRLRAANELKVRRVLTAEQLQLFRTLRRQAQQRLRLQRRLNRPDPPRP